MSNKIEIVLPKMGESVDEATITGWLKNEGDFINEDDLIVEIATDKVDSEVPSEFSGVLIKKLCEVNDVVKVGDPIAVIETENEIKKNNTISEIKDSSNENIAVDSPNDYIEKAEKIIDTNDSELTEKIYSPLVKNISKKEGISFAELDSIIGSGKNGRVTKKDILNYISKNKSQESFDNNPHQVNVNKPFDEITEMSRMEKLISDHMLSSKQKSAHVQAFIEADITNLYKWREKNKTIFLNRENEKITFTPIFISIVAQVLREFPLLNSSVEDYTVIKKKSIKNNIDPKITRRIWINMIYAYIDYERRNFKKK